MLLKCFSLCLSQNLLFQKVLCYWMGKFYNFTEFTKKSRYILGIVITKLCTILKLQDH